MQIDLQQKQQEIDTLKKENQSLIKNSVIGKT